MLDDGAVTEKIVNLSVIIVMACYMVEMTPWCIMGRWTLAGAGYTEYISCHWYPGYQQQTRARDPQLKSANG